MSQDRPFHELSPHQLQQRARELGIEGRSKMKIEELAKAVDEEMTRLQPSNRSRESGESRGTRYAQHIDNLDEHEERLGRTLTTRNHDVIQHWAEERHATPATVPGTEHQGRKGVLRFDFAGYGGGNLQHISWEEWFKTFDERELNFIYQEHKTDGSQSNFFRLEKPGREDA